MGDAGAANRGGRRAGARARLAVTAAALTVVPSLAGLIAAGPLDSHPGAGSTVPVAAPEAADRLPDPSSEDNATEDSLPVDGLPTLAQTPLDTSALASGATTGRGSPQGTGNTAATPGTVEQRGAAALALIDYPWQRTGYSVAFGGPNEGLMGLTEGGRKLITIYVRPGQSARSIAWVLAHEIGHAVDFTMTTDAERAAYRRIRGLDDRPWYPTCRGCSDYTSPAGDWAETFAAWLLGDGPFASQVGSRPTAAQLNALTPLFAADAAAVAPPTTRPPAATTTTRVAALPAAKPTVTVPPSTSPRPRPGTPTTRRSTPTPTRPSPPTTTTNPPSTATTNPPTTATTRPPTTTTRPWSTTTTRPATTTTRPSSSTTTGPPTTTTAPRATTTTEPPPSTTTTTA